MSAPPKELRPATAVIHAAEFVDQAAGGVTTPIFTSTATLYPNPSNVLVYPRYLSTPNAKVVAGRVAALEAAEAGVVFSTGMAAIVACFMSYLKINDHLVVAHDVYGGSFGWITTEAQKLGISYSFAAGTEVADFEKAIQPGKTKMIYLESPSNPLLQLLDLAAIAKLAKSHNVITVIDNTFATPMLQQPIKLGLDIVLHSATKYLNGHSDLQAGVVVSSNKLIGPIAHYAMLYGGTLNSIDLYLLERGLKTLSVRMKAHCQNALALAKYLQAHPAVSKVHYPGLESHPSFELAKKQMRDFGGMVSFDLKGTVANMTHILSKLHIVKVAVSLGGVDTTVTIPAQTSHGKLTAEERAQQGISDTTIRMSVGIEDAEDLIADFEQALKESK